MVYHCIIGGEYLYDCGFNSSPEKDHNPPLLFDLSIDSAEERPLNITLRKYADILTKINHLRYDKLRKIHSSMRSKVDWSSDWKAIPCCNQVHANCRC